MSFLDSLDFAELAAAILEKGEIDTDEDMDVVEEALMDRFGIDLEQFAGLIELLLPFCAEGRSPLTDRVYRGFARDGCFIIMTEV